MALWPRILALVLAVLPAVWGQCPCCQAGCDLAAGAPAASSSASAERCPCCAGENEGQGDRDTPRSPVDCDGCAGVYLRGGATPAPAGVELPTPDLVAALAPALLDSTVVMPVAAVAPHGPAPPGPPLAELRSTVLLI